eukprot:TRINITY_DN6794_c0_g1_i1.p1 TRINITY_DN6794_c0_g1~~TRINITY_DN6794_c0_g1_i1.p1  ORF type:complete len:477 (+),score=83.61 TRINITY_DN6794_c0_g1_i1:77-1432(+)
MDDKETTMRLAYPPKERNDGQEERSRLKGFSIGQDARANHYATTSQSAYQAPKDGGQAQAISLGLQQTHITLGDRRHLTVDQSRSTMSLAFKGEQTEPGKPAQKLSWLKATHFHLGDQVPRYLTTANATYQGHSGEAVRGIDPGLQQSHIVLGDTAKPDDRISTAKATFVGAQTEPARPSQSTRWLKSTHFKNGDVKDSNYQTTSGSAYQPLAAEEASLLGEKPKTFVSSFSLAQGGFDMRDARSSAQEAYQGMAGSRGQQAQSTQWLRSTHFKLGASSGDYESTQAAAFVARASSPVKPVAAPVSENHIKMTGGDRSLDGYRTTHQSTFRAVPIEARGLARDPAALRRTNFSLGDDVTRMLSTQQACYVPHHVEPPVRETKQLQRTQFDLGSDGKIDTFLTTNKVSFTGTQAEVKRAEPKKLQRTHFHLGDHRQQEFGTTYERLASGYTV